MKLFASRKRKVEPPKEERTVFQSDPVVEELLKKDPSTWNAKQRRMIQRYRERNPGGTEASDTVVVDIQQQSTDEEIVDNDGKEPMHQNNDDEKATAEDPNEKADKPIQPENNNISGTTDNKADNNPSKAEKDAELDAMLEKLSSKQRRTLTRLLERTGDTAAVKEEARKMLDEKEEPSTKKNETVVTEEPPSKRRRKSSANWDTLTPEERMRREEQKRLQKEAAERRARGESIQHRHPLNSERRRANRRKPKYDNTKKKVKSNNEHNTSGFSVRKSAGKN
jgi:hypothetical protein